MVIEYEPTAPHNFLFPRNKRNDNTNNSGWVKGIAPFFIYSNLNQLLSVRTMEKDFNFSDLSSE